ncbi:MAG: AAA family ATPase [Byssovorax sp.]
MATNRITRIRVQGLRTLADVTLDLDGLTVLIGDNGSGKSSLIEACEILRRAAGESFTSEVQKIHGGAAGLFRFGATQLRLSVRLAGGSWPLEYSFAIREGGLIDSERFGLARFENADEDEEWAAEVPKVVLKRNGETFSYLVDDAKGIWVDKPIDPGQLALTSFGKFAPHPMIQEVIDALRGLDVQLPFDTTARWAQRERGMQSLLRGSTTIEPADSLSRFGGNLASAFNSLRNEFSEAHWRETMDYVRLGLGQDVESINTRADPGGGVIALRLKYAGLDAQIPSFNLSDGMLAYLCFVALYRLNTKKSLIAFDEPETHLHPELLMRVLGFFEEMAKDRPVLLTTHSDRLLDGLSDPARSVVLCELDERRATRLVRPDADALREWLKDYRGLGDVRSAGHAASVMKVRGAK